MIFVTLGTHHQPFHRLVQGLRALPGEQLVVQYGHSPAPAAVREAHQFLSLPEMEARLRAANVVVTHAGVGSILMARQLGHTPVVAPRQHHLGEHVDDHQAEITAELARMGKIVPLWDVGELAAAVAAATRRGSARPPEEGPLHHAVRAALGG